MPYSIILYVNEVLWCHLLASSYPSAVITTLTSITSTDQSLSAPFSDCIHVHVVPAFRGDSFVNVSPCTWCATHSIDLATDIYSWFLKITF